MLNDITPMVLTFNEIENIRRTLEKLRWATRIVVIDSGSTDGTLDAVLQFPQVEVFQRPFDSFAEQCNFGLAHIKTEWGLSLDADYELSDELVNEIDHLDVAEQVVGYRASFTYCINGRPLRGAVYPPRVVLYRVQQARYENEGHGHRVSISGKIGELRGAIRHDDRKPFSRWITSQQRYAAKEAAHILSDQTASLSWVDRLRSMAWPAPLLVFAYVLFVKGCVLDGRAGWFYAFQRLAAETLIALELIDRRLNRRIPG